MQIIHRTTAGETELDLRVNDPGATAQQLAALLPGGSAVLRINGAIVGDDRKLLEAGLYQGSIVETDPIPIPTATDVPAIVLEVVGGHGAGARFPLTPGTHTVGRSARADLVISHPTVSRLHCTIEVSPSGRATITNLSKQNGIWVGGIPSTGPTVVAEGDIVELGDVQVTLRRPHSENRTRGGVAALQVGTDSTISFNRPPRSAEPAPPPPISVPTEPASQGRPVFSMASLMSPIILGAVTVTVSKNPAYAMMALPTALMILGNWFETRRRSTLSLRRDTREYRLELRRFSREVDQRRGAEILRRRTASPDLVEVVRRAAVPSVRLWERRPHHDDFLLLSPGLGDLAWRPPLTDERAALPDDVSELLCDRAVLPQVPLSIALHDGGIIGLVGDREAALGLARGLICQVAVHQGPADLSVAVASLNPSDWEWAKWLPHSRNARSGSSVARSLASDGRSARALLEQLATGERCPSDPDQVIFLVIDGERLLEDLGSLAHRVLKGEGGPVTGIVITSSRDLLPALCTAIITLRGPGELDLLAIPQRGTPDVEFIAAGLVEPSALGCARSLARYADPELSARNAGLPDSVPLLSLLGLSSCEPATVQQRWDSYLSGSGVEGPIGMTAEGPFIIDLSEHGPHGLIGGTTGSGKSELLKTLIASLAASAPPSQVNFGLFDFKGGSGLDALAGLPHVVGLASDLDLHGAARALRCLGAELRRRKELFRSAGVEDIRGYWRLPVIRSGGLEPLPRLVVVIDEFAAMMAELGDLLDSLLKQLASQGRSFGVHLILATQKPSGVVNDTIRANTLLRIALRVEDRQDSEDVVGRSDAVDITSKGRAYIRLSQHKTFPMQTALVSTTSGGEEAPSLDAAPFRFGPTPRLEPASPAVDPNAETDLTRLIAGATAAFAASGLAAPRRPWPDALPDELCLDDVCPALGAVADRSAHHMVSFALADDPEAQSQYPTGWKLDDGNLALFGMIGSGTTTALTSLALALARTHSPDSLHLYVMDFGAGELLGLAGLPHTGAVIGAGERERHVRLVRLLRTELDRRKGLSQAERDNQPAIVVMIDGIGSFTSAYDAVAGFGVVDDFSRVYSEGPEVGIHAAVAGDRPGAVSHGLAAVTRQKMLFRLGDGTDYDMFGIPRRQVPRFTPGRAVLAENAQVVQVARPLPCMQVAVSATARHSEAPRRPPAPVLVLSEKVSIEEIQAAAVVDTGDWFLPLGIADRTLEPAGLLLFDSEHATIAGPAKSGKSTALCSLATITKRANRGVVVRAIAWRRSPLRSVPHLDELVTDVEAIADVVNSVAASREPTLLLIDDADGLDDPGGALVDLLSRPVPHRHVVVAGRADVLKTLYGHWTQTVRRSKVGVLLQPNTDLDGDLLGGTLPRRSHVPDRTGRGYIVNNADIDLVQLAGPLDAHPDAKHSLG